MKKIIILGIICLFVGIGFQSAFANIRENNPPYEPSNPIPPNGSTNVSSFIIKLRWTCGDPDGDEVYYNVYFGNYSPPPLYHGNTTYNYTTVVSLELNTTYYWEIVATDEHGASTPGAIWTFTTTGNSPPNLPILMGYENETLYFYSIDPDGDDIRYHINWGDGTSDVSDWYPSGEIVGISHTYSEGRYHVRIKAEDIHGAEACCLCFEIRIGNRPPEAPKVWWSPKNPKQGETINLTFNAVDPDGDDVRFIIEWPDGETDTTTYVPSGINKTVSFKAGGNGTYYYYITAEDDNGAKSDVTIVKIVVGNPPDIDFVNPKKGYFHIYGVPLFKNIFDIFSDTANIGGFRLRPIQVKCNFEDPNNHTFKVQLRINGEDMGFGTWNPETECFEWYWTGLAIGEYDLMLRYIDEHGGVYWAYMSVWNLCFLP